MVELTRTVRFCISLSNNDLRGSAGRFNSWAGYPPPSGISAYCEIHVRCRGTPDAVTGYVQDISAIDECVRERAIPVVAEAVRGAARAPRGARSPEPARVLREISLLLREDPRAAGLAAVAWQITPTYALSLEIAAMHRVLMRQQFSFSAAHRLHVPALGDEANRRLFGRCNNPSGHGHNYRLEVAVAIPMPEEGAAPALALPRLEQIVDETVVRRFDHKHLNVDTAEFAAINPTVEHIARVCHDLLRAPIAGAGGDLVAVTVWETDKTSCTYPA
jgi:6-pyruvoyltetrahydropterin/6-carboxytetrahydropterin synthase